jgi:glycerophosphoryl diester phosphodiesterase
LLLAGVLAVAFAGPAAAHNRWLGEPVMNVAQRDGGDTMYGFRKAVAAGADMLALDVHATADGRLIVMRDWTVDRTTDGTGYVSDLTLAQVRRLDAAYHRQRLRGIRTGDREPPRGFKRTDFRVPTLAEVLRRFAKTPLGIEIRGRDDDEAQFLRNAELLAGVLAGTRRRDLIVASSSQPALDRFHELLPEVALGGVLELAAEAASPESVLQAHRAGLAVHVRAQSRRSYDRLLAMCVDGIITSAPKALERRLRSRHARRVDPCSVRATRATVEGRTVAVGLERRGLGPQAYEGGVTIRSRGRLVGREDFELGEGTEAGGVTVALTRFGRRLVDEERRIAASISVRTRGSRGGPRVTRMHLCRRHSATVGTIVHSYVPSGRTRVLLEGAGRGTQSGRTRSQGRIAVGGRRSAISPREPVSSPRRHTREGREYQAWTYVHPSWIRIRGPSAISALPRCGSGRCTARTGAGSANATRAATRRARRERPWPPARPSSPPLC